MPRLSDGADDDDDGAASAGAQLLHLLPSMRAQHAAWERGMDWGAPGMCVLHNIPIVESLRLEKTSKIIESNH